MVHIQDYSLRSTSKITHYGPYPRLLIMVHKKSDTPTLEEHKNGYFYAPPFSIRDWLVSYSITAVSIYIPLYIGKMVSIQYILRRWLKLLWT